MAWINPDGSYKQGEFVRVHKEILGDLFVYHKIGRYVIGEFPNGESGEEEYCAVVRKSHCGFWITDPSDCTSYNLPSLQAAMAVVISDMAKEVCK